MISVGKVPFLPRLMFPLVETLLRPVVDFRYFVTLLLCRQMLVMMGGLGDEVIPTFLVQEPKVQSDLARGLAQKQA